jgi:hypothetical protein
VSCGQSSKIKNAPAPIGIAGAEAYGSKKISASGVEEKGDPNYLIRRYSIPIVPSPMEATLPDLGPAAPLANGLAKLFLKTGVISGKKMFSLNQPIPISPVDVLHSMKLSRVFFIIEEEDFSFINRLAIRINPKKINNPGNLWTTSNVDVNGMNGEMKSTFETWFDEDNYFTQKDNLNDIEDVMVLKYDKNQKSVYTHSDNLKYTYVIYAGNAAGVLDNILFKLKYRERGYVKHYEPLEDAVFIELNPDASIPIASLKAIFENDIRELSANPDLGFRKMNICKPETCLDLKVPDMDDERSNLLPLLSRGNSIQMDAFVDVIKAPGAFKVRGFIEAEMKVLSPIK